MILWAGPFLLASFAYLGLTSWRLRELIVKGGGVVVTITLFLFATDTESVLVAFLRLRGSSAFVYSANGTSSWTDIKQDLLANFHSQMPEYMLLLYLGILGGILLLSAQSARNWNRNKSAIHAGGIAGSLLALGTWVGFATDSSAATYVVSRYMPVLAAYEPFLSVSILFPIFLIELYLNLYTLASYCKVLAGRLPLLGRAGSTRYSVACRRIAIHPHVTLTTIAVVGLLFVQIPYWENPGVPAAVQLPGESASLNALYHVPEAVIDASTWLSTHADPWGGSRVLLAPQGGYLNTEFQSAAPSVDFLSVNQSLWNNGFYPLLGFNQTTTFSTLMGLYAVQYILLFEGPYPAGDPASGYTGPARMVQTGFPWSAQYLPIGGWRSWDSIMRNQSGLRLVANQSNFEVFSNSHFRGAVYAYSLESVVGQVTPSDIVWQQYDGSAFLPAQRDLVSSAWSGLNESPWSNNWTLAQDMDGGTSLLGGPLPSGQSYTNLWEEAPMQAGENYSLSYAVSGANLTLAFAAIRFYSGSGMSGTVVNTMEWSYHGSIPTPIRFSLVFTTPLSFGSAALFVGYESNPANPVYSVRFDNVSLRLLHQLDTVKISQVDFSSATQCALTATYPFNVLLVQASSFNPGWKLLTSAGEITASPVYNGFFIEPVFLVGGNTSLWSLSFEPQSNHAVAIGLMIVSWALGVGGIAVPCSFWVVARRGPRTRRIR